MENLKSDIFIFLKENGEKKKIKDCTLNREFMYNRNNFFLLSDKNFHYVCVNGSDNELYSIWSLSNKNLTYNECLSIFRKEYDKNGIQSDLISNFLKNPLKYTLLKKKKTKKKT